MLHPQGTCYVYYCASAEGRNVAHTLKGPLHAMLAAAVV